MKLIELLVSVDKHVSVRIEAFDDNLNRHTLIGDNNTEGRIKLMREINKLDCLEYTVTDIDCIWHTQELYIKCMKW